MTANLRTPREHLADQYARDGRHSTAREIRRGEIRSEGAWRALRAIEAAQIEALALRTKAPKRHGPPAEDLKN